MKGKMANNFGFKAGVPVKCANIVSSYTDGVSLMKTYITNGDYKKAMDKNKDLNAFYTNSMEIMDILDSNYNQGTGP